MSAAVVTKEQVLESIRQADSGVLCYQPDIRWLRCERGGRDYWFPPDIGGKLTPAPKGHPQEGQLFKGDGTLRVQNFIGKEPTNKKRTQFRTVVGDTAPDIAAHLAWANADLGVCLLNGTEEEQKAQKFAARKRFARNRTAQAHMERAGRMEFVRKWKSDEATKNQPVPPPLPAQREAIEFLISGKGDSGESEFKYASPDGVYQTNDFDLFTRYMKMEHPDVWKEKYESKAEAAEPPSEPEPKKPARRGRKPRGDSQPTD